MSTTTTTQALFQQALQKQLAHDLINALNLYQRLLVDNPQHQDSLFNAGLICVQIANFEQAIYFLKQAASLHKNAAICSLLGLSYMNTQQTDDAIYYYQLAIQFDPNEYVAHNHLGSLYCQRHQYAKGIGFFKKAIDIAPHEYSALSNLGMALMQQGEYTEAALYFKRAIVASHHQSHIAYQNLLLCLCFDEQAFPTHYLAQAQQLAQLFNQHAHPYHSWPLAAHTAAQPLNIGLVCGDINNHPVGYFLESFISHVNPQKLNFFVYNTLAHEDDLTLRVKAHIKQWHTVNDWHDSQIAECIYQDGIHILIDLAGHTAYNKLAVFAFKPAPIQVSWLGYFASTGMNFIDYFIADPISVPAQYQSYFNEKIAYLAHSRLCFSPPAQEFSQDISPLPATQNGHVHFACFQSLSKINDKILRLWSNILRACPHSQLVLLNHQITDHSVQQQLLERLVDAHIEPQQVIFKTGLSRADYFKAYSDVDFMLDTFPYPGGTTTCEALWMGVPTLTLTGRTLLERQGHTILANAGLNNWICATEKDYIQKAIEFAHNIDYLAQLRQQLRQHIQYLPIMNANLFAQDFEQTLYNIWHNHMTTG